MRAAALLENHCRGMAGEEEYTRFENDLQARPPPPPPRLPARARLRCADPVPPLFQARLDVVGAQLGDVHAKFRDAVRRRDRVELALLDQERTIKELEKRRLVHASPASVASGAPAQAHPLPPPAPCVPKAGMLLAVKQQHCDMRLSTYTKARPRGTAACQPPARPPTHLSARPPARPQDFVSLTKSLGKSKGHVSAKEAEAALKMVESRPVRRPPAARPPPALR